MPPLSPMVPMSPRARRCLLMLACAAAAWVASTLCRAADGRAPAALRFAPAPGTQVDASVDGGGAIRLRITPGERQVLAAPEGDGDGAITLGSADFDFDGHADLYASASVGMVNQDTAIYLFDPATRRFRPLPAPEGPGVSCSGFWDPTADAATRTVTSSCRSGPMWYTDVYRHDPQRGLYVYRTERVLVGGVGGLVDAPDDNAPLAVWTSYAPDGRVLERVVAGGLGAPPAGPLVALTGRVADARAPLHARPAEAATRRYLVAGDRFEALDVSDDGEWLMVRYRNPQRGAVEGWLRIPAPAP